LQKNYKPSIRNLETKEHRANSLTPFSLMVLYGIWGNVLETFGPSAWSPNAANETATTISCSALYGDGRYPDYSAGRWQRFIVLPTTTSFDYIRRLSRRWTI